MRVRSNPALRRFRAPVQPVEPDLTVEQVPTRRSPTVTPAPPPSRVLIEPRTVWLAAGIAAGGIVLWIVISRTIDTLLLFFSAVILAEGLRPLVERLHTHLHLPRALAVLVIYAFIAGGLAGIGWLLVQPLLAEARTLIDHLPEYVRLASQQITGAQRAIGHSPMLSNALGALKGELTGMAGSIAGLVLHAPLTVAGITFKLLEVTFMTFFWLTATAGLRPFIVSLFPEEAQGTAFSVLEEMGNKLGGYLRGTVVNMLVVGVLTGAAMWILGVPYPILLGTVSGLTEALPLIGTFIGQGVAIGTALITSGWITGLEVYVVTTLIQQFEGNVLVPIVMNRAVDLNPLTVALAILMGGSLFGVVGAVVAVPGAVLIKVLVMRVLVPAARQASARYSARRRATQPDNS